MKIKTNDFPAKLSINYFLFEKDFVDNGVRCIPMVVRYKLDTVAIKLSLKQWSDFSVDERVQLALRPCTTTNDIEAYTIYLVDLIHKRSAEKPVWLLTDTHPEWHRLDVLPSVLLERLRDSKMSLTLSQWASLTAMQRFALIKLSRSRHEHKNFPKAMKEFGLVAEHMARK